MATLIKPDSIVRMDPYYKVENIWLEYKPKLSFLGVTLRKEGIYYTFTDDLFFPTTQVMIKKLPSTSYQGISESGNIKIYYKPSVIIHLIDGSKIEKYFESKEELDDYLKQYSNFIKI